MALFGFFNFNKEGPGIEKDAPKKRAFIVFFETYFRNFWKFLPISIVYSLLALPQLTSGLANVGITHVARNTARDKHSFGFSDFFETIKKNWKQALPAGIINTIVYIVLFFDVYFFYIQDTKFSIVALAVTFAFLFIFTIMNYYMWTLIITFGFNLKTVYKNSLKFVFLNIKNNLICFFSLTVVVAILVGLLFLFLSIIDKVFGFALLAILLILALCYPGFKFLLIQYCVFPAIRKHIIDPYYEAHPDADIEKRRQLGVYDEEEETEEEEDLND